MRAASTTGACTELAMWPVREPDEVHAGPNVVHVVPLNTTSRGFKSEVVIDADPHNGLEKTSVARCQHVRAVASARIDRVRGNVGPAVLAQVRESVGLVLDIPR